MAELYSFFLNHYRWVILIGMLPYCNLIRRYILLRYGTFTVVRGKKGTAVLRGVLNNKTFIKKYGTDAVISGVCSLLIVASSQIVPYFHSMNAAVTELTVIIAAFAVSFISCFKMEKFRIDAERRMREISLEKILKMLEQQKNDSIKK